MMLSIFHHEDFPTPQSISANNFPLQEDANALDRSRYTSRITLEYHSRFSFDEYLASEIPLNIVEPPRASSGGEHLIKQRQREIQRCPVLDTFGQTST